MASETPNSRVVWNDKVVLRNARLVTRRNLELACMFLVGVVVKSLSKGQPIMRYKSGRVKGLDPSRPGEPPHVLLGRLRQSITYKVIDGGRRLTAIVGTAVIYARRLELGFIGRDAAGRNVNQAPRPFLRRAVRLNRARIGRIVAGGGR